MRIISAKAKIAFAKVRKNMEENNKELRTYDTEKYNVRNYRKDAPAAVSGINTPGIELPAFNPPVPNRAWTALKMGKDIDELSEEEKRDLYMGRDSFF